MTITKNKKTRIIIVAICSKLSLFLDVSRLFLSFCLYVATISGINDALDSCSNSRGTVPTTAVLGR